MRTHLRSSVLALALVSLAAVPAQAHSTSPPGASLQATVSELVTPRAYAITTAVPALVSAAAWKLLQAPQVLHAEHVTDVAHAIEASACTAVHRQRARRMAPLTSIASRTAHRSATTLTSKARVAVHRP